MTDDSIDNGCFIRQYSIVLAPFYHGALLVRQAAKTTQRPPCAFGSWEPAEALQGAEHEIGDPLFSYVEVWENLAR
jgi:hypothetical protein